MIIEILLEILIDAIKDSLLIFPFLLLTYALIEFIERRANLFSGGRFLTGKNAPLYASLLGIFPQCGFSVMSAKFFDKGIIKGGTLLAVFISTSDEAFAILISNGKVLTLLVLIFLKFIIAIIFGYLLNFIIKTKISLKYKKFNIKHEEYCKQCGNSKNSKNNFEAYFFYPLLHALKTLLFIFIVNLLFNLLICLLSEEAVISFMQASKTFQPFLVAAVGLIPNCASSILITQLYLRGGMAFGSMLAGLSANAGIGLAIIFKNKSKLKSSLLILITLYLISVISGFILNLFI